MKSSRPLQKHASVTVAMVMVMMMMMVMVMVMSMAPDHDRGSAAPVAVVVMVVVVILSELDVGFFGSRRPLINDLEDVRGIGNRLQQVSVGVGLQGVYGQWGCRRGLRSRQRTERRYRSQKPGYLLFHVFCSKKALPDSATRPPNECSGLGKPVTFLRENKPQPSLRLRFGWSVLCRRLRRISGSALASVD